MTDIKTRLGCLNLTMKALDALQRLGFHLELNPKNDERHYWDEIEWALTEALKTVQKVQHNYNEGNN